MAAKSHNFVNMNWIQNLSLEEIMVVEELRKRTVNDLTPKLLEDESLFYRFCKARDFKLEDAEAMLRMHIIWRRELQIDTILTHYKAPEVVAKYLPYHFVGFDKEGSVIRYVDFGNIDIKGIFCSSRPIDILKFSCKTIEEDLERLEKQNIKIGKKITMITFIFNFENLSFSNATNRKAIEFILAFAKIFQDNYPERVKRIFFINVSFHFYLLFSILKTALASTLLKKIYCYGSDWKEDMLKTIDADVLPEFLGGNRTDPDGNPQCITVIKPAEIIPESYYLCKTEKKLCNRDGVKKLIVTPFSRQEKIIEIKETGLYLEWEFETKSKDIMFAVYFKENPSRDSKLIEVIPKQRIDTCYETEKGFFRCEKPGIYTVVFDNSYSWIHSKELYYRISVLRSPKDSEISLDYPINAS